ncbi:MAG: EAL domain-containing protein [Lachnospiraceae bacterium]|nr:EAL domain-containing protein [Lachnospiraceae bacterium]
MSGSIIQYYNNFTPVADVLVIAMCLVFVVLVRTAYIKHTKGSMYLSIMVAMLFCAAVFDIFFHISMNHIGSVPILLHYIPRTLYHTCLFGNLWMYVIYINEMMHLEEGDNRKFVTLATVGYAFIILYEILGYIFKFGYYIDYAGTVQSGFPIFPVGYMYFVVILIYMVVKYRERVFRQVVMGVLLTVGISLLVIVIQFTHGQFSFTTATFLFPIYALLYLVHSNPYDIESGALGRDAFHDFIRSSYERKRDLLLMSLYLHDFDNGLQRYPAEITSSIRYFVVYFFKDANLFKLSEGHLILAVDIRKNPDYHFLSGKMIKEFNRVYPSYGYDYKIVITDTWDKISEENDYEALLRHTYSKMSENTIRRLEVRDINEYINIKYIIKELGDINEKMNMSDPRIQVYCQPVYNIQNDSYDTAEALMRLKIDELGIIYPNVFIPLAEQNGYICTLTKIIMSKTCKEIRKILDQGYNLKRVSVNFSIFDIRDSEFCVNFMKIIRSARIPCDKIAIEITESQTDSDFKVIKEKINQLKGSGIKFYLDDFGTGYSNFERIMELPFDIIKFDRSLVVGTADDEKVKVMVSHLAKMFSDMDYAVLYEGVESEKDEHRCKDMGAKYLQGYRYSKPIPIEQLTDYLKKAE